MRSWIFCIYKLAKVVTVCKNEKLILIVFWVVSPDFKNLIITKNSLW